MLKFRTVKIEDRHWMMPILENSESRNADYDFGNIYMWDRYYNMTVGRCEDRIILKYSRDGNTMYSFPIGNGSLKAAVEEIKSDASAEGNKTVLRGVEDEGLEELKEIYGDTFEYELERDECDYVYLADKLSTFSGKALHGQKNHCNNFEKNHEWEFKELTRDLMPGCADMTRHWVENNKDRLDESEAMEIDAVARAFSAYEALGLEGGVLFAEGKIIGYSVGEMKSRDTFDVHFEKADTQIKGAYTMVCREMTRLVMKKHPEVVFMNREEDMGLEMLRKAKTDLKPEYLLNKYIVRFI